MYMQVTPPSADSTIRLQLKFQTPNCSGSQLTQCPGTASVNQAFRSQVQQMFFACETSPFLLVAQPAPNAFVLIPKRSENGSTSESLQGSVHWRPRFHVIIGPQLCSCIDSSPTGAPETIDCLKTPTRPCVHILFVLFRVLHASMDDPTLSLVPLPTDKAESLIQAHIKRQHHSASHYAQEQKCYLSQVSSVELGKNKLLRVNCQGQTGPISADPNTTPLVMPKPIYPPHVSPQPASQTNHTPQLLAAMHATRQNSPDCSELSKLTNGVQPSTRREVASVDFQNVVVGSGTTTTTCASRTSSTESSDSPAHVTRAYRSARSVKHHSDFMKGNQSGNVNSLTRRPRTVPQPDPPPLRTEHNGTHVIRHASSTTFRPIRDYSPEHKLTPIRSEETSAENSLKYKPLLHERERQLPDDPINPTSQKELDESQHASSFRHWTSGPFKPIPNRTEATGTKSTQFTDESLQLPCVCCTAARISPVGQGDTVCALCLQILNVSSTSEEPLFQCQTTGPVQRCCATFHQSCCQIWLEELEADGDSVHCPVCLCRWETLPLDCPLQSVSELTRSACLCTETNSSIATVGSRNVDNHVIPTQMGCDGQAIVLTEFTSNPDTESRELIGPPDPRQGNPATTALSPPGTSVGRTGLPECPFPDYRLCVAAFTLEVADGIASRTCARMRQLALQHAAHLTVRRILLARQQHQLQTRHGSDPILNKPDEFNSNDLQVTADEPDCLRVMFRLIQHLFDDPVDAVFIDALRAFRELLGYLVCFNSETQIALQRAIGPIIRRLLRFTGGASVLWSLRNHPPVSARSIPVLMHQQSIDSNPEGTSVGATNPGYAGIGLSRSQINGPTIGNQTTHLPDAGGSLPSVCCQHSSQLGCPPSHSDGVDSIQVPANLRDRANLALATLVELAKGQNGALAIGRDVGCTSECLPVCGLHHMTRFVLSSAKFHATHLVGRLTLLEKLIRMDQAIVTVPDPSFHCRSSQIPSIQSQTVDRLARRHLCSSLVFARRHLIPPVSSCESASCIARSYEVQSGKSQTDPTEPDLMANTNNAPECNHLAVGLDRDEALKSLHNTQLKASRVARRVFLTAARALLTYDSRHLSDWSGVSKSAPTNYGAREFCPREFVELEISRTEPPLAAWLRNKLASVLYPNLVPGMDTPLIPIRMIVSESQPNIPPRNVQYLKRNCSQSENQTSQQVQPNQSISHESINETKDQRRGVMTNSQTLGNIHSTTQCQDQQQMQQQLLQQKYQQQKQNNLPEQQQQQQRQQQQQQQQSSNAPTYPNSRSHSNSPQLSVSDASRSSPPVPPPRRPHGNPYNPANHYGAIRDLSSTRKLSLEQVQLSEEDLVRRNSWTPKPTGKICSDQIEREMQRGTTGTHYVRIALEPAYDLVALSESGNYSSVSEGDGEDEDEVSVEHEAGTKQSGSDETVGAVSLSEPTYGGRSLSSEAELQTEQAAVLRSALRRCSRSLRPLLPVPALSMVMEAFRSTNQIPSTDEYYESVDWIRGPILGQGAFSQCYQARDTRTGLLMAVKRIRLGGGSVLPVITDPAPCPVDPMGHIIVPAAQRAQSKASKKQDPPNPIYPELSPEAAAQLVEVQDEVNIMLQLNHPNVLRLFGAVYCSRRAVVDLFVEWMPGGSVTGLLRQYGAFNESVTLAYGLQVVRGLAYLHRNGILHRDLKGANLLVDTTGSVVRISDFGASARLCGEQSVTGQFQGQVIGTFSFMAPEVLRGETYGRACDIWSVGCCLLEMLTSKPPWHDSRLTNRYALMFAIATSRSPPTYPDGLDPDVLAVLNACFSRNATERPTASKLLAFRAFSRLTEPSVSSREDEKPPCITNGHEHNPRPNDKMEASVTCRARRAGEEAEASNTAVNVVSDLKNDIQKPEPPRSRLTQLITRTTHVI